MRIYLLGLMGSGKTTAGKKLAKKLNYKFVDLDDVIVDKCGCSIAEYFEKKGEESFRLIEQQALRESFIMEETIVSTGGGAPCFFNNMDEILANGISFYLKANTKLLFSRLKDAKNERPLLNKLTNEQLTQNLEDLLEKRERFYSRANYSVNAVDPLEEMIQILLNHKVST